MGLSEPQLPYLENKYDDPPTSNSYWEDFNEVPWVKLQNKMPDP